MKTSEEIVRACFAAYETKDRDAIEALIADDFTFTSPLDDNINRATYFERCWPNSGHIKSFNIERLFVQGDEVCVQYEVQPTDKPPFRNTEIFKVRDEQVTRVEVYFGAETHEAASQGEIRAVIETRNEAIRQKDVARALTVFAEEPVCFSLAPPLQATGSLNEGLAEWFATFRGNIGCETRGLTIHVAAGLACAHCLNRYTGEKVDGEKVDIWFRETLVLRQREGRWRLVHDHESVPFYMDGSLRAAVDLKPE